MWSQRSTTGCRRFYLFRPLTRYASDDQGRTYASLALPAEQLMVLRFSADEHAA